MPRVFKGPPRTLGGSNQWRLETRDYTIYCITRSGQMSGPGEGSYVGLTSVSLEGRLNWHLKQSSKEGVDHPLQKEMRKNPNGWVITAVSSVTGNYYEAREEENVVKEKLKPNLNYTNTGHY